MYAAFYKLLPANQKIADGNIHLLNEVEISFIKKTEKAAVVISAFIGAVMVIILYLPQYILTNYFATKEYILPLVNRKIELSILSTIYGTLLVLFETYLLTLLNIYCTHEIALSTGFIDNNNKTSKEKKEFLLKLNHKENNKNILKLGINPYLGLNKSIVFLLNLLFSLKASLSNFFIRIIVKKILGRYALRLILDFIGIPVFAFWNAMGTAKILKDSRIVIMGVNYLQLFEIEISKFRDLNSSEKVLIYDTLQYIAICKRDYHQNHCELTKIVIERFSIKTENLHLISKEYENKLKKCDDNFKKLNENILILGMIIDGRVSYREKKRINKFCSSGVLTHNFREIKNMSQKFIYGKGIDFIF
jgi:hypothetical protein